jgi:hypothetical protein
MVQKLIPVQKTFIDLRAELHIRLLLAPHDRSHMRLVDAHYPFRNSVRLLRPNVAQLLENLRDRLHIHLNLLLERILRECTKKLSDRLQVPVHIAKLLSHGCSQLNLCLVFLLSRLQIYLACLLELGPLLLPSMHDRHVQFVDDFLTYIPAGVQKLEVRRIGDVLWAGRRVQQHYAAVGDRFILA